MKRRKLRLGVLLDSYEVPAWAYHSLERIANSDYAEFVLIILSDGKDTHGSEFYRLWKNRHEIVYQAINRIDEELFVREPNPFELRSLQEVLPGVSTIRVKPSEDRHSQYFEPSDVARIKEYRLDIMIGLGSGDLRGDILTAARYGIWLYRYADTRVNRGAPPGFQEVVEGRSETSVSLCMLADGFDEGRVLCRSRFLTYPFSPARNRSYVFWASSSFLPRQIERLHRLGGERYVSEIEGINQEFDLYDGRPYEIPSNFVALRASAKLLARAVCTVCRKAFYVDQWYLMLDWTEGRSVSFHKFKQILPPKDRFWADPHVIQVDGTYYVFVEEYMYKARRAHISVMEIDTEGNVGNPVRVLEEEYHLSYPFVFEWGGRYYMVPESAENRTIDLYECIEFPHNWRLKMSLMQDVSAVDTTLFHHHGKWWLFTGMAENEGAFPQVELFLFSSDDLFTTEWVPHPLNPIVSDARKARPAGKLFARNGRVFRPSQNCSKMYGYGFDLNEVLLLSETEYVEERVASVRPHWDKDTRATHTFGQAGQLTVIDAFMRRPRFW